MAARRGIGGGGSEVEGVSLPWFSLHVEHVRPPRSLHISPQHCECHQAHRNSVTLILLLSVNRIHNKK